MIITQTADIDLIAALNKPIQDLHVKLYPEEFVPYDSMSTKSELQKMLQTGTHEIYVAEENGNHLGYVWLEIKSKPANAFKKGYTCIYVHQIGVMEQMRKRGVGSKLLEHVYDVARKHGIAAIELDYWCRNTVAKDFYQKHGFDVRREVVSKTLREQ